MPTSSTIIPLFRRKRHLRLRIRSWILHHLPDTFYEWSRVLSLALNNFTIWFSIHKENRFFFSFLNSSRADRGTENVEIAIWDNAQKKKFPI
ncbi:hypothetical protein AAC387_Pa02g2397 [Persea americana]